MTGRRIGTSVGAVALVSTLGCAPGVTAAEAGETRPAPACLRVGLDPQPVWTFDGRWLEEDEIAGKLVLTDPGAGVLHLYDRQQRVLRPLARPGQGDLDLNRPSAIWPVDGGFLTKDGDRFVWLDDDLKPVRSYALESVPVAPGGTVRALFDWAAAGEWVYGAGDVLLPDGSWRRGLLAMDLGDATSYRMAREIPVSNRQEFDHYLMGYPLVTVLGSRGYFLQLSKSPAILEVDGVETARELGAFPKGFESRPALPLHSGATGAEVRYRAYESARLPVGIFGRERRLYVLAREPLGEPGGGGTRWTLTRIDPEADRVEGSVVLPTRAAHLTLVPGPEHWAVLEKGRVERYGHQPIPSLLLVPTAWIEAGDSPLAEEGAKEELCDGP